MDELRQAAESMKRSYTHEPEKGSDEAHTIHNPLVKDAQDSHEGVTPATAAHQASAPEEAPVVETETVPASAAAEVTEELIQPQIKPVAEPVKTPASSPTSSDKQ